MFAVPRVQDAGKLGIHPDGTVTPARVVQACKLQTCEPYMVGMLRWVSHQACALQLVRVLHCVHMDLCGLQGVYCSTVVDDASLYACVRLIRYKSDTAAIVTKQLCHCPAQTDRRVQRVRDRSGGDMSRPTQDWYAEKGTQMQPTAGYTQGTNGAGQNGRVSQFEGT
jgi:hypothetical protein